MFLFGNLQRVSEVSVLNGNIIQISNLNEFCLMKLPRRIQYGFNLDIWAGGGRWGSISSISNSRIKLKPKT